MPRTNGLTILITCAVSLIMAHMARAQDCATPTTTQPVDVAVSSTPVGQHPSVSLQPGCGRFIIAWQDVTGLPGPQYNVRFLRFTANGTALPYSGGSNGTPLTGPSSGCPGNGPPTVNQVVSVSMGRGLPGSGISPPIHATWTLRWSPANSNPNSAWRVGQFWRFDDATPPPLVGPPDCTEPVDAPFNSAGVNDGVPTVTPTAAWARGAETPQGLLLQKPNLLQLRNCDPPNFCFINQWTPCIATRDDGSSVATWCEAQSPTLDDSRFDIYIAQFAPNGDPLPPAATPQLIGTIVHRSDSPGPLVNQLHPAVAFRGDRIVVAWQDVLDPFCPTKRTIRARVFEWGGDNVPTTQPIPLSDEFVVNRDRRTILGESVETFPTVALRDDHRFIVCWNATNTRGTPTATDDFVQVRAQYFDSLGSRRGGEFGVSATEGQLAQSGQHTAAYAEDGQVVVT